MYVADDRRGPILSGEAVRYSTVSGVQDVVGGRISGSPSPGPAGEAAASSVGGTVGHTGPQDIYVILP